jgi:microcystin-dependent protein
MMKTIQLIFYIVLANLIGLTSYAQTGINTGNTTPTKMLDINGELRIRTVPQVTVGDVLVADVNGNIVKVSNYLLDNAPTFGDVKKGFQSADHQGWYLLNGRLKSSLPTASATNATALGIGTNLPDARGKFLKTSTSPATVATTGGTNTPLLTQANLPNFNFTGATTSSAAASHSHTGTDNYTDLVNGTTNPSTAYTTSTLAKTRPLYDEAKVSSIGGAHTHTGTVSSNTAAATAFNNAPQYIVANVFIYLGQ